VTGSSSTSTPATSGSVPRASSCGPRRASSSSTASGSAWSRRACRVGRAERGGQVDLLTALTGFRPADEGRVEYAGRDLYADYDELRQRIGLVPQDDILHPQLTVRRALRYAAELRFPDDVGADERARRVDEVITELGLTGQADQAIHSLSGGQRKRTSVALELLTRPSLLFLDEPTSGLDPGLDKSVMRTLRGPARGRRLTKRTQSASGGGEPSPLTSRCSRRPKAGEQGAVVAPREVEDLQADGCGPAAREHVVDLRPEPAGPRRVPGRGQALPGHRASVLAIRRADA
jgi:ABC-type transport system involved in cytochrome c biogenesis ATPase subunit